MDVYGNPRESPAGSLYRSLAADCLIVAGGPGWGPGWGPQVDSGWIEGLDDQNMVLVYAYGPKTEVAKRFFFVAEVLDATLMMGWGGVGHVNVPVNLLRFLMLRWWWGGVGWGGAC